MTKPEFRPVARQNPPVLLPLETVCSARKHPLSSVSGRRRYNTLDLCTAKSCANRALSPLLETQNPRDLLSLGNPSSFTHLYPQTEKRVCDHRSINAKNPTVDPRVRRGKTVGFLLCRIHCHERNSRVTHRCGWNITEHIVLLGI